MSRGLAQIVVLGLVLGTQGVADADSDSYSVTFRAGAGCPSEDDVLADVAAHIRDLSRSAGVRIELHVARAAAGFSGELRSRDASGFEGTRQIQGRSCSEVAHALAFLAALAIELGGRVEPSISTPPAVERRPAREPIPQDVVRLAHDESLPALSFVAAGELRGGLEPTLRPQLALGIDLALRAPRILGPSLRWLIEAADGRVAGSGRSADVTLLGGRLEACALRLGTTVLSLHVCADAEVGALVVTRNTATMPQSPTEVWAALGASLRAQWLVTARFFVEASGGPDVVLARTSYFFEPAETVYVSPPLTGRGGVGVGLRF